MRASRAKRIDQIATAESESRLPVCLDPFAAAASGYPSERKDYEEPK
jgi:hypothetical protein